MYFVPPLLQALYGINLCFEQTVAKGGSGNDYIFSTKTKLSVQLLIIFVGTQQHSWLRHCATSREVAGSILNCIIGIFYSHLHPSGRTWSCGRFNL